MQQHHQACITRSGAAQKSMKVVSNLLYSCILQSRSAAVPAMMTKCNTQKEVLPSERFTDGRDKERKAGGPAEGGEAGGLHILGSIQVSSVAGCPGVGTYCGGLISVSS